PRPVANRSVEEITADLWTALLTTLGDGLPPAPARLCTRNTRSTDGTATTTARRVMATLERHDSRPGNWRLPLSWLRDRELLLGCWSLRPESGHIPPVRSVKAVKTRNGGRMKYMPPIHPTTVAGMRSAKKSNAALGHEDAGDVATAGVCDVRRLQPATSQPPYASKEAKRRPPQLTDKRSTRRRRHRPRGGEQRDAHNRLRHRGRARCHRPGLRALDRELGNRSHGIEERRSNGRAEGERGRRPQSVGPRRARGRHEVTPAGRVATARAVVAAGRTGSRSDPSSRPRNRPLP